MTLTILGRNQTLLTLTDNNEPQGRFFFSYHTLVAAWTRTEGFVRTATRHSRTTERHIKAWCAKAHVEHPCLWTQERLESLLHL